VSNTLFIHGGPILTMDDRQPVVEAVALQHGDVLAVGSAPEVRAAITGSFDDIDLRGRLATPGLIDAHAHIVSVGLEQRELDVSVDAVSSIAEIARLVQQRAQSMPAGAWIVGNGYDQASLAEQRHPVGSGRGRTGSPGRAHAELPSYWRRKFAGAGAGRDRP
jgi:predicted amidohydrolase YtcJ